MNPRTPSNSNLFQYRRVKDPDWWSEEDRATLNDRYTTVIGNNLPHPRTHEAAALTESGRQRVKGMWPLLLEALLLDGDGSVVIDVAPFRSPNQSLYFFTNGKWAIIRAAFNERPVAYEEEDDLRPTEWHHMLTVYRLSDSFSDEFASLIDVLSLRGKKMELPRLTFSLTGGGAHLMDGKFHFELRVGPQDGYRQLSPSSFETRSFQGIGREARITVWGDDHLGSSVVLSLDGSSLTGSNIDLSEHAPTL